MRFRLAQIVDVPELTRMYVDYMRESQPVYPVQGDDDTVASEWAAHQLQNLIGNPSYFCIVGVVQSKIENNTVVGGKPKAMMTVFLTIRPIGFPKEIGFCEMLWVDPKYRNRGHTKRLAIIASRYAFARGAKVLETSWRTGSQVGEFWQKAGMRSYQEYGAWILEDGSSRLDLPYADSLSDAPAASTMPKGE
jgi:ribosomal protein S18 acetylase RimI-like enzyme